MRRILRDRAGQAALVISIVALVATMTGLADAARKAIAPSTKPKPHGLLLLNKSSKFPSKAIPTVAMAKDADKVDGHNAREFVVACPPTSVDLGTWCLDASTQPLTPEQIGKNNYFYATQRCVNQNGYLPTAAQLIGAANRVKLNSTIDDSNLTASIDEDTSDGWKDKREMTATLITTQAGSSAAGSEGVSEGSKGDPKQGEPDPVPQPQNPRPDTLQYVTVYDNGDKGGFAGSKPVSQPENFRCAFDKAQGRGSHEVG
jgi:hypothetical protein